MKKTILIFAAAFAFAACQKESVKDNAPVSASEIVFDLDVTYGPATKATKKAWAQDDKLFIFFQGVTSGYATVVYDETAGKFTSAQINGTVTVNDLGSGKTLTAIYLPYGNDAVASADGTSFKFDKTFTSYFLKAEKAAYTVSGTTVNGTLNMVAPEGFVQFAMPLSGTINENATTFFRNNSNYKYTLSDSNLKPVSFASVASDGSITVTEGAEGEPITGYIYGGDINFSGVLSSTANGTAADYEFTFVNNNGTAGTYDDVTYLLSGNKTLSYKAAIKFPAISNSAWKVPEPSYVEINGVKWATCNIGATTPGGYGDFFAWGATYPQAKYESADYREGGIGDIDLASEKDVAYQKLGSEWHMPTYYEISSIISDYGDPAYGVTWTWISDTATYGTVGYEVYLTSDPSKKIFLPTAGVWINAHAFAGRYGQFWSSNYDYNNSNNAFYLEVGSSFKGWYATPRYYGQSVRPVHN